jgi:hypothetical protein
VHTFAAIAALALAAVPAASAAPTTGFELTRTGGNIRPFTLRIDTAGVVRATGAAPAHRRRLTKLELAAINRAAFVDGFQKLPLVTLCRGTLPDIATQSIRVGGRTVRVHGTCLAGFDRLWTALSRAVRP